MILLLGCAACTECIDAAYCSSVVCMSVCLSVGHMSTVRFAKTAEPIDMWFWMWTSVDPRNNVLGGGGSGKGQFGGGEHSQPILRYREYATCDRYFQLYLVDGCSDAAFRCQYCCNLIVGNATVRIVCGAGSMHLSGVRPSVRLPFCPSVCPSVPPGHRTSLLQVRCCGLTAQRCKMLLCGNILDY